MKKDNLIGLGVIVLTIGLSTFAIVNAVSPKVEVKTVSRTAAVAPSVASPSAVVSSVTPTVGKRISLPVNTVAPKVVTGIPNR